MNKYFFICIVLFFNECAIHAQIPFNQLYEFGSNISAARRVTELPQGYFVTAGFASGSLGETARYLLIDSIGKVNYKKEYIELDKFVREGNITRLRNGAVVDIRTIGEYVSQDSIRYYLKLFKCNSSGDTLSTNVFKAFGIGLHLSQASICERLDSGLFVTCLGYQNSSYRKLVFISTDKNGNELWRKIIDNQRRTFIGGVIRHPLEGFLIGGGETTNNKFDPWLMHVNDTGKVLWKKNYAMGYDVFPKPFIQNDQSIIFNSNKYIGPDGRFEFVKKQLFKTDIEGNIIWNKVHDDHILGNSSYTKCIQGLDGLIYCLGRIDYHNGTTATLSQINQDGDLLAVHRYTYNGDTLDQNYIWDFIQTSDSGFLFVGDYSVNGQDVWVLKTKKNGCIDEECSTLIYGAFLGTEELKNNPENNFKVYPNPNTGTFVFTWNVKQEFDVLNINVSDVLGKTVIDKNIQSKQGKQVYTLTNPKSGIYLLKVSKNNNVVYHNKLVISE